MIGNVAQKRTHLAALAVLVALAVAMFAVIQSADAAVKLTVAINDSDNVVKAGAGYDIELTVDDDNERAWTIEYITASGGVHVSRPTDGPDMIRTAAPEGTLVVPANAEGVYTITAGIVTGTGDARVRDSGELEVTVGDVGTPIGAAEVSLGTVLKADGAFATATTPAADKKTDAGTKGMGSVIAVTVNTLNSLGNAPNAGEVDQVILFAPAARVLQGGDAIDALIADSGTENSLSSGQTDKVSANFFVRSLADQAVDVYAVVIGTGGTATSATLTLRFTGAADSLELGAPSSPLAQKYTPAVADVTSTENVDETAAEMGSATLEVTATDKAGSPADLTCTAAGADQGEFNCDDTLPFVVKFVDADDNPADTLNFTATQKGAGPDGPDTDTDPEAGDSKVVVITVRGNDTAPGEYTLKVNLTDKDPVETTIVVAGPAKNVELSTEQAEGSSIVTVTATVTDADGNLVPDAGGVDFIAAGGLSVTALDDNDNNPMNGAQRTLDDGVASVRYVIIGDSGTVTIIVSAAAGVDDVTTFSVGDAEAAAPEAVSLACLSATNGFATYTCGVDSSASELFGLVSGRGATAVHLWNGSDWVRYSVVDGAMVPGSSDFTVTENDILYISN